MKRKGIFNKDQNIDEKKTYEPGGLGGIRPLVVNQIKKNIFEMKWSVGLDKALTIPWYILFCLWVGFVGTMRTEREGSGHRSTDSGASGF